MALHQFFLSEQVLADEHDAEFLLALCEEDFKHASVLRLRSGEHLAVVDASGHYYECEIVRFEDDKLCVRIASRLQPKQVSSRVMLVQGLAKGDKMSELIRHATEIGVNEFYPFEAARSVTKLTKEKAQTKTERWQSVARSAAMQSGQLEIPTVHNPCAISDLKQKLTTVSALLICWEEAKPQNLGGALHDALTLQNIDSDLARIAVVVGPEGGMTAEEVDILQTITPYAYQVSLGPSILRTETAGVVASALALYELGRLG